MLRFRATNARMEPLAVIGVFLLGASVGSLVTTIRYRSELAHVRAKLEHIQKETERKAKEAA